MTLTSTAPANAASLPPYISSGTFIPKGEVRTNVMLYAPTGGRVERVRASSGGPGFSSQTHNGLAVVVRTSQLKPGERFRIVYDIITGKAQPGTPVLRVTPVALSKKVVAATSRCR